jgi:hypothetical protein
MLKILDNDRYKIGRSSDYNFNFDKQTGYFERWGVTKEDDPQLCEYGPEIADIEISSVINEEDRVPDGMLVTKGCCKGRNSCGIFCYKKNGDGNRQIHMSLDTLKSILDKTPQTLTQIAYGICDIDSHPQFFEILEETRRRGIIPNFTTSGIGVTKEIAEKVAKICGAVAVSVNSQRLAISLRAVQLFNESSNTLQTNIHYMLSEQTYDDAFTIIDEVSHLPLFKGAVVFLAYKPKQPNQPFTTLKDVDKYKKLIEYCHSKGVRVGFDSCSCPLYMKTINGEPNEDKLAQYAEKCEANLHSLYINCKGEFYPCSFSEGMGKWESGINLKNILDFNEIWHDNRVVEWRNHLLKCDRNCPIYNLN